MPVGIVLLTEGIESDRDPMAPPLSIFFRSRFAAGVSSIVQRLLIVCVQFGHHVFEGLCATCFDVRQPFFEFADRFSAEVFIIDCHAGEIGDHVALRFTGVASQRL